jgi:hypothetical protein
LNIAYPKVIDSLEAKRGFLPQVSKPWWTDGLNLIQDSMKMIGKKNLEKIKKGRKKIRKKTTTPTTTTTSIT